MFMDDMLLRFQGFTPSEFTRTYLSEKLSVIHEAAPYGSTLDANFTRKDNLFKGVVTIHSAAGKFFAVASGTRVKDVTHKLIEQIRRQLNRWKSRRFERRSYDTDTVA